MRAPSIALLLTLLLATEAALAQNTMFLRRSPIAQLDDADRALLRETIDEALKAPDGTVLDWSNPKTGSRGRIKVLDTHEDLGTTCRNLRARNESRGRQSDGIYRLCLAKDGTWKFASAQTPPRANPEPDEAD